MARNDNGLTPKQEAFCAAYLETGNATKAYRLAYDVSIDTKPNTVEKRACELLKVGKVAGRIRILQSASASRVDVTIDKLSRMAMSAYDLAMSADVAAPGAAIAAVVALGKLHGFSIDKKQVTAEVTHSGIPHEPISATYAWIRDVLANAGQQEIGQ